MEKTKSAWIKWIDPEVGVVAMECEDCGCCLPALDPPAVCPQCGREKGETRRGEVFDDD